MVKYDIAIANKNTLFNWISSQPDQLSQPIYTSEKILCEFNHDAQQEKQFKIELAKQILQFNNGITKQSLLDYIQQLLGDHLFCSIIRSLTLTNIGTSYVDVFPALYNGFPIPVDTTGFKKLGVIILWNKNSGTGRHDVRLINNGGANEVFVSTEGMPSGIPSGLTKSYNIAIPQEFHNFRGELRIQAKSDVATDDPVFDGLLIYLIR